MKSERRTRANRLNAKLSTGPRSANGKTRSAQNARRHGLSLSVSSPTLSEQVKSLAIEIAGDLADPRKLARAQEIAELQVTLLRIRQVRDEIFKGMERCSSPEERDVLIARLSALDRYEGRALSKRKFAIREFATWCRQTGTKIDRTA
jgi:hypothetical protein